MQFKDASVFKGRELDTRLARAAERAGSLSGAGEWAGAEEPQRVYCRSAMVQLPPWRAKVKAMVTE